MNELVRLETTVDHDFPKRAPVGTLIFIDYPDKPPSYFLVGKWEQRNDDRWTLYGYHVDEAPRVDAPRIRKTANISS